MGSIRARILKVEEAGIDDYDQAGCRRFDPNEDTERGAGRPVQGYRLEVAGDSIRTRILKVKQKPMISFGVNSCRRFDPNEDTERSG